jgi:hypothetical protein
MLIVLAIALAKLLFHIYFNNRYGYFRDEFDYISCGDHLAWGYVDQPPLIPFLIHICRAVLGDSLRSIRFIPALASSLLVVQTAVLAREFGGDRFALLLSAITIVIAPQYLSNGSLLGTNCLEPNLWMGSAYFAALAIKRANPRYWLWVGVVAGLGMEEKYSIAIFGFGIVIGLLLTAQRRVLLNPWIWLGGLAAVLILLPNLLWNIHNDWPFLQLIRNIRDEGRDVILPLPQFFLQQTFLVDPIALPIWLAGLFALLFSARLKPYRMLGWCYLTCFTVFFVLHGKVYYLAPVYPMLLAAGAVVIESAIDGRTNGQPENIPPRRAWLKAAIVVLLLASGAHLAPVVVPILSPDGFLAYAKHLPMKLPVMEHDHARRRHRLPRPPLRPAAGSQRRPHVFSLGTARLFRQLPDRPRRPPKAIGRTLRSRRIRRHIRRQSLRAREGDQRLPLPRREIRYPGPTLAATKALALDRCLQ